MGSMKPFSGQLLNTSLYPQLIVLYPPLIKHERIEQQQLSLLFLYKITAVVCVTDKTDHLFGGSETYYAHYVFFPASEGPFWSPGNTCGHHGE